MKKYIVCDACYMVHREDYDSILMPLWFPVGKPIMITHFQAYGGDFTLRSLFDVPTNLIQYSSTNSGDCSVEGLGCDAGNFCCFEMECSDDLIENLLVDRHMFRLFSDKYEALNFLDKIISLS